MSQQWRAINPEEVLGSFPLGQVGWWGIGTLIVFTALPLGWGILMIVIASWPPGHLEMPTISEIDDYNSALVKKYENESGTGKPQERAECDLKKWHEAQIVNCATAIELVNDRRQKYLSKALCSLGVTAVSIGISIILVVGYNLVSPKKSDALTTGMDVPASSTQHAHGTNK